MQKFLVFKQMAMVGVLIGAGFLWAGHAVGADPPNMDSQYIKEHFPEVYFQIYQEGRQAGQKDAEAAGDEAAAAALSDPALTATAPVAAGQTAPGFGAWWEKSSLKYAPLPAQWLFHIEGTLDYKHKTGNTQSDLYNGSANLMVRKWRFTNTLSYIIGKELTEQLSQPGAPPNRTDSDYRSIQDALRYDLTGRLYTEGGYLWEMDTANYISGRDSYYLGLGYVLIDKPKHLLDVFAAGGYVEEQYPELVKTAMNMEHDSVTAGYFMENYRWIINDRLTYKQRFRIIQDLTATRVFNDDLMNLHVIDKTHRYRWFLINEVYFALAEHLSLMIGYKIDYDSNPWPTVKELDTTIKTGIQFSF